MRFTTADNLDLLIDQLGAVSPRQACVIADIGLTRLYELIAAGELESYLDGKSRKVTLRSIKARRDRLLSEAKTTPRAANPPPRPPQRKVSRRATNATTIGARPASSTPPRKKFTRKEKPGVAYHRNGRANSSF
jgi:hypothetical protein